MLSAPPGIVKPGRLPRGPRGLEEAPVRRHLESVRSVSSAVRS